MNRYGLTDMLSTGLSAVGALNWGLKGFFGFNLVRALFGWSPFLERTIYSLVGLAGAWLGYRFVQRLQRTRATTGAQGAWERTAA